MSEGITYRPATVEDYGAILALNAEAVPSVNLIAEEVLSNLHRQAFILLVAETAAGSIAGFMLALDEAASYDSINYGYFQAGYPQFIYVDRIVVSPRHQRLGIGWHFYKQLIALAGNRPVTCEVNLRPANPESLAFHERFGFARVAEQDTEGGRKRVALLVRSP